MNCGIRNEIVWHSRNEIVMALECEVLPHNRHILQVLVHMHTTIAWYWYICILLLHGTGTYAYYYCVVLVHMHIIVWYWYKLQVVVPLFSKIANGFLIGQ